MEEFGNGVNMTKKWVNMTKKGVIQSEYLKEKKNEPINEKLEE